MITLDDVAELPDDRLPAALASASAVVAAIAARLAQRGAQALGEPAEDRLLDVDQAAAVLGISTDMLYGSPALKTLRVKVGGRVLFSARRLQAYIARRAGQ
jgi:hypothetical protein